MCMGKHRRFSLFSAALRERARDWEEDIDVRLA